MPTMRGAMTVLVDERWRFQKSSPNHTSSFRKESGPTSYGGLPDPWEGSERVSEKGPGASLLI
jgi:hypothetical protein